LKDTSHEDCRRIVELWLMTARGRAIADNNSVEYPPEFIKKHKWKKFPGHSYDIVTPQEVIEIDDLDRHLHKEIMINDNVASDYAETYIVPKGFGFYRIIKEEIVDRKGRLLDPKDVALYLRENLF
jgi:hypothetical protein